MIRTPKTASDRRPAPTERETRRPHAKADSFTRHLDARDRARLYSARIWL